MKVFFKYSLYFTLKGPQNLKCLSILGKSLSKHDSKLKTTLKFFQKKISTFCHKFCFSYICHRPTWFHDNFLSTSYENVTRYKNVVCELIFVFGNMNQFSNLNKKWRVSDRRQIAVEHEEKIFRCKFCIGVKWTVKNEFLCWRMLVLVSKRFLKCRKSCRRWIP